MLVGPPTLNNDFDPLNKYLVVGIGSLLPVETAGLAVARTKVFVVCFVAESSISCTPLALKLHLVMYLARKVRDHQGLVNDLRSDFTSPSAKLIAKP